jgi:arylsulfatase A-like enzyme
MGYTNPDPEFYTTDAFTDYAIERLEEYKHEDNPFLLYLPYTAPHYPLHAWPEDIAKYRGKFRVGWDVIRVSDSSECNNWALSARITS